MVGAKLLRPVVVYCVLSAMVQPAAAQPRPINISATNLADALSQLARSQNVELLFDKSLVAGLPVTKTTDIGSVDQALDKLLAGTGLSYRQTTDGTFIIESSPTEPIVPRPVAAIEDILVIGRRTQNVDIRRSEDDIQPYQIATFADIADAQSISVEDFVRNHLSSNTQAFSLSQEPATNRGATRSQINLRGLGTDQTLVLVDGRRLPSVPFLTSFTQPDINGISPAMIDRIETLAVSAGGIVGIGAAGGVVNLILRRNYEGADFGFENGLSAHGDAWRWRADGRAGFAIPLAGVDLFLHVSHSEENGLAFGDRDFVLKARAHRAQQQPSVRESVASPSINFNSPTAQTLTFVPSLGGGSLNASTTFLPIDAPPVAAGGASILSANAGRYDINLSDDGQGTHQTLVTPMTTNSFLLTARKEWNLRIETYLDLLWLQNEGVAIIPAISTSHNTLQGGAPGNPFREPVTVSFPTPGLEGSGRALAMTSRISAGILLRLGNDWSINFDASYGQARLSSVIDLVINAPRFDATRGVQALNDQLASQKVERFAEERAVNSLADFNLRFGGALFDLPGGPVTLTGTAEFFRESTPGDFQRIFAGSTSTPPRPSRQQDISAFFELRAPLIPADSDLMLLRGLEMQLALRRDSYDVKVPGTLNLISGFDLNDISNHNSIVAETVGVRVTPSEDVTIRASASTGFTPATSAQLVSLKLSGASGGYSDPLRGGFQPINFTSRQDLIIGGSSSLRPQGTTTYSAGFILRPSVVPGLRVSLDYSRLYTTGEITNFAQGDRQYFINHEEQYPGRVVRAPLTPGDSAAGFTGGAITSIDTSYLQIGHSTIQAIDLGLDYRRSTSIGSLSFFGQATWEPEFVRSADPGKPSYNLSGRADGPLAWRANGGVRWYQGIWTAGLGFTFFDAQNGYSVTPLTPAQMALLNSTSVSPAGTNSDYIPPQVYLDAFVALRSTLRWAGTGLTKIEARLGMKNVLNAEPPLVASTFLIQQRNLGVTGFDYNPLGGYSPFGDPIGRRIEMNVTLSL